MVRCECCSHVPDADDAADGDEAVVVVGIVAAVVGIVAAVVVVSDVADG